jgi:hypothetical protein
LAAQIDGHAVLFITIVPIVLPNVTWAGAWWPMAWGMALWEMVRCEWPVTATRSDDPLLGAQIAPSAPSPLPSPKTHPK